MQVPPSQSSDNDNTLSSFAKTLKKQQKQFDQSSSMIYYIVSSNFITQWIKYEEAERNPLMLPSPMNQDIVENGKLKKGVMQETDFQLIGEKSYQFFKKFSKEIILKRHAYFEKRFKMIPIHSKKISYIVLKRVTIDQISSNKINKEAFMQKFKNINLFGPKNTSKQFLNYISEEENLFNKFKSRVWISKATLKKQELFQTIKTDRQKNPQNKEIKSIGTLVESEDTLIHEWGLQKGQFVIIESCRYDNWLIEKEKSGKCETCDKLINLKHSCGCKKVFYCNQNCKFYDRQEHKKVCSFAASDAVRDEEKKNNAPSGRRGLVGLSNLGNTCFMNSCLQCLSHTLPLTQYFLNGYYNEEINRMSPHTTHGKLARAYGGFIKSMWNGNQSTFSPYTLKSAEASINQIFSGYAQHDSQQFLTFLIDGIHEDLNRIQKLPYVPSIDSNGRPDDEVAMQSWMNLIQRNQSIISEMMIGQYKSKVRCPDCKRESVTFDPFNSVTLPIPQQIQKQLFFFVLFNNNQQETKKLSINYQQLESQVLFQTALKKIGRKQKQFQMYFLTFHETVFPLKELSKKEINQKYSIQNKQLFLIELSLEQQQIQHPFPLVVSLTKKCMFSSEYEALWVKRPFFFNPSTTTGLDIVQRILKYLYNNIYKDSTKKHNSYFGIHSQTFENYYIAMMKNRPFVLYLRSKKTLVRMHQKVKIKFDEYQIFQDQNTLYQMIQDKEPNDFEIQVKFTEQGARKFDFDRLKNYKDEVEKNVKKTKGAVDLEKCFEVMEQEEQLEKGNQWYCSSCKEHKLATKQIAIFKAPEILILHLKRFKNRGGYRKQKDETCVNFPFQLNLQKYVKNKELPGSYISIMKQKKLYKKPVYERKINYQAPPLYELYATSNHFGGLGGGHYTAYAKNRGKWFSFNDSSVGSISESHALNLNAAYILFYRRKNV